MIENIIRHQIGCSEHGGEVNSITEVSAICYLDVLNSTLIFPIPFKQKSNPGGVDASAIVFGVIGGTGAVASVVSSAIASCKTRPRPQVSASAENVEMGTRNTSREGN
jgi:hypothetical protein